MAGYSGRVVKTVRGGHVHVRQVLHRQKHLSLNIWDLYAFQRPIEDTEYLTAQAAAKQCDSVCVYSQGLKMCQMVEVAGMN